MSLRKTEKKTIHIHNQTLRKVKNMKFIKKLQSFNLVIQCSDFKLDVSKSLK